MTFELRVYLDGEGPHDVNLPHIPAGQEQGRPPELRKRPPGPGTDYGTIGTLTERLLASRRSGPPDLTTRFEHAPHHHRRFRAKRSSLMSKGGKAATTWAANARAAYEFSGHGASSAAIIVIARDLDEGRPGQTADQLRSWRDGALAAGGDSALHAAHVALAIPAPHLEAWLLHQHKPLTEVFGHEAIAAAGLSAASFPPNGVDAPLAARNDLKNQLWAALCGHSDRDDSTATRVAVAERVDTEQLASHPGSKTFAAFRQSLHATLAHVVTK